MATAEKRGRGRPPKPETLVARAAVAALQKKATGDRLAIESEPSRRLNVKAKYDAAGMGRRMAGWNPPSSGPNRATEGLERIRNRARDSRRNDWSGQSANQKWSTNLIGIGITPRFKRLSKARKQAITDLYNDFVEQADADGVLNLYGLQTLAVETWLDSGEVFIRRRPRFLDEGLAVPLQVQLIEGDMCPLFDADTFSGLPANNYIRSGIELSRKRNQRVAYWFLKEHPGDTNGVGVIPDATSMVRVPAAEVRHMFKPTRPGQLRGVSLLAPILARLRNIENYDDATLTRQQLANMVVGFITRGLPKLGADEVDGLTGQPYDASGDATAPPLLGMQPGLLQELEDGQDIRWSNPPEAGTDYPGYMRTQHMGTSAAAGIPYEIFSGDIKEVSDRTLRVLINEFRRLAEQKQWQIVIPMLCQPVIDWFAEATVLAGKATAAEYEDVRRVEHAPHGWAYIHPVQDPQGKKLEVEAGFRSRSAVVGAQGDDPEQVDQERADDMAREKSLGLWVDPNPQAAAGDEDGIDDNEYQAPPQAHVELLQRAATQMQAQQTLLSDLAAQLKSTQADLAAARREASSASVQDRLLSLLEPVGGQQ